MDKLYTLKELGNLLKVSRATTYRLIDKGYIKPIKLAGKVLFLESEIDALIERLKQERDNP
jgi:excisionase family DNA binding protein